MIDFIKMLSNPSDISKNAFQLYIQEYHVPLPVKVIATPKNSTNINNLVFCFHGAIDRSKRSTPAFDGKFLKYADQLDALCIAIADPALELYPNVPTTWYAGTHDLDVPNMIKSFVASCKQIINPAKIIFVGSSTGGHAALRQSNFIENSISIVSNPIVCISNYYERQRNLYVTSCWEGGVNFLDSVTDCYSKKFSNRVIYLCNSLDHHIFSQAAPFLSTVNRKSAINNFRFHTYYDPAYSAHSTPPKLLSQWVEAACNSDSIDLDLIAQNQCGIKIDPPKSVTPSSVSFESNVNYSDFEIAQMIYKHKFED